MNVVFLSPHFPLHFYNFCDRLKQAGAHVLSIGDAPYDSLPHEVRDAVTEYYYLPSLENYDDVMRAVAYYIHRYGRIDHVESQNEYWLELEARLRTDFNIANGWKTADLEAVKLKSRMKEGYAKAHVKTARWKQFTTIEEAIAFADEVGFPIIVKPDNGVGAGNTWRIDSRQALCERHAQTLSNYPPGHFIMEEFVPGHVETFDGIADAHGHIAFCTGQVMKVTPLAMLSGTGENVSYTQPVERTDLMDIGSRVVKAFGVKNRFFHFEFFRLDEDKPGIGHKGEVLGLEVNMRAPGGYIPDKMNYAYDVDVYRIWAETLVWGGNHSFGGAQFKRYVTHFGRGAAVTYRHTAEEVRTMFGNRLLIEKAPPKGIAGGMGAYVFVAWSDSVEELEAQARYVMERADGTNWI